MLSLTHENNYTESLSKLKKANSRKNLEYDFKLFLSYNIKPNNKYYKDFGTIYPQANTRIYCYNHRLIHYRPYTLFLML